MRFVADESCDFAVVRALRAAGYEVVSVVEISPRADDKKVLTLATETGSILLTEDKDFGQLIHADGQSSGGVVLLRFPTTARRGLPSAVVRLVNKLGERLIGRFVVVRPGRVRIGSAPGGSRRL